MLEIGEQVETEVNLKETFNSVNTLNKTQNQLEAPVIAHLAQSWPQKRKAIFIAKYIWKIL